VRYSAQLSGPLLDRIDVFVEVDPLTREDLDGDAALPEGSAQVQARVAAAQRFRGERTGGSPAGLWGEARPGASSEGHPLRLESESHLDSQARRLVREALARGFLGGRGFVRALAVARTLADLDGVLDVGSGHVAEALTLRRIPWSRQAE